MKYLLFIWLMLVTVFNYYIMNNIWAALMPGFVWSGIKLFEIPEYLKQQIEVQKLKNELREK